MIVKDAMSDEVTTLKVTWPVGKAWEMMQE